MNEQKTFEDIPKIDDLKKSIKKLKECDLSKIGFRKLWQILENEFGIIPFLKRDLVNVEVDRVRINRNIGEIFTAENQISYREDVKNIEKFGRANSPFQSMFYGAISTKEIKYSRITSLIETSEIFRDIPNNRMTDAYFLMTLGKWTITKPITVIDLIFNKKNIEDIEDIKISHEKGRKIIAEQYPKNVEQIELILEFFSDEFAKENIKTHNDYKISCIYSHIALNQGINGIIYPSVRTKALGYNIALTPSSVDYCLNLTKAAMFKVEKVKDNTFVKNYKLALDLGNYNTDFKWKDAEK